MAGPSSARLTAESFLLLLPQSNVPSPVLQEVVLRRWGPRRSLLLLWGLRLWLFFSRDEGHQAGLDVYQLSQLERTR